METRDIRRYHVSVVKQSYVGVSSVDRNRIVAGRQLDTLVDSWVLCFRDAPFRSGEVLIVAMVRAQRLEMKGLFFAGCWSHGTTQCKANDWSLRPNDLLE